MKHKNYGGWNCLAIFLTLAIVIFTTHPDGSARIILFISEIITGIILTAGIFITPNEPPHFAIVTRWGRRLWKKVGEDFIVVYVTEGWSWHLLRGIMYNVLLIDLSKREIDFPEEILTTPDAATTKVPGSMAYTLDQENIINFLNLGGKNPFAVLEDMITDIVQEKLRVWARETTTGPKTWEELLDSSTAAVKMLIEAICGPDVIISDEDVVKIRSGNGKWRIKHFGIFLNRFNLKEMTPFGEIYGKALKLKAEEKEREAETYEVKTDMLRAEKLQEEFLRLNVTMSIEVCLKMVMDWKITREANQLLTAGAIAKSIAQAWKGGTTV